MSSPTPTLYDDLLAVYERACREGDLKLAESLFSIFEETAGSKQGDERLEHAYKAFITTTRKQHKPN